MVHPRLDSTAFLNIEGHRSILNEMSSPDSNHTEDAERRAKRLARLVDDAIDISDRFAREPVFSRTGKGTYKSVGVEGLRKDIDHLKKQNLDDQTD